jgi:hypothetical protein
MSNAAIVTAADARHYPYLANMLSSLCRRSPESVPVHVFDLGFSAAQRRELQTTSWIHLRAIEPFVPHWRLNWSWKPYIMANVDVRHLLYLDAPNLVVLRSLRPWFLATSRDGYFVVDNGQRIGDMTPPTFWSRFGLEAADFAQSPALGAGILGIDRDGPAGTALLDTLAAVRDGLNLGCSADEFRPSYDRSVVRDCAVFRADQTLFNLAFRKAYGTNLTLHDERKYCGKGGRNDAPRQYVWYARRQPRSMTFFWRPFGGALAAFVLNRATAYPHILLRRWAGTIRGLSSRIKSLRAQARHN